MGWATLSAAANRVACNRLGSVSVVAGAVSGRGFLKLESEMILGGEITIIDYLLTVPTSTFGSLGYGDAITVDGVNYKVEAQPQRFDDGAFCRVPLIPGIGTTPPPSGAVFEVRIDGAATSTVYVGRASVGTAEAATGWTIKRRTFSAAGVLLTTKTASGAWTARASLTYS
jgi:hypothetical protein